MVEHELARPIELSDQHWQAIVDGIGRAQRARRDEDWRAAVGAAKELCETVAKVALAARHADIPDDYPKLMKAAHVTLARDPGFVSDRPLRDMAQAARSLATSLAELRNAFGTGHGHAIVPDTTIEHAGLAIDAAFTWCRWALRRLDHVLRNTVDRMISDLAGGETFYQGTLARRLAELDLSTLGDGDLERLGRAVAHRGLHRETFVVRVDGLEAVAAAPAQYPEAFRRGLIAGIFVDENGYVRADSAGLQLASQLVNSLDDTTFFDEFTKAVEGKDFSYAMNLQLAVALAPVAAAIAESARSGTLGSAWARLRAKFASASN
jgi:hypothetical protein